MNGFMEEKYFELAYKRIAFLPILLLCFALFFVGCKTIKESEITEIHDTLIIHHSDTVKDYKSKILYDTVHHWHFETITLSERGDTTKHVINNYFREHIIERDSTDKYKSSIDSLKALINQLHEKEKEVVKEDWLEVLKGKILTFLIVVLLFIIVWPYIRKLFPMKGQSTNHDGN